MPFEQYVETYIFAPLSMAHSTFRQPLPADLRITWPARIPIMEDFGEAGLPTPI